MILNIRHITLFFLLLIKICISSREDDTNQAILAPIYGKNYYLPHLVNYSFPGFSSRSGEKSEKSISTAYYGINEFLTYNSEQIAIDYESSVLEGSFTFRPENSILLGVDIRVISYYGGFMDTFIEMWHSVGNFPNGDREFFPRNKVKVSLDNTDGQNLYLTMPVISLGDTDLYCVWTIKEDINYSVALAGAFKLPTGTIENLSGSNSLDTGIQVLGEFYLNKNWGIHIQQGFIFPGDVIYSTGKNYSSRLQSQSLFAFQFLPVPDLSVIVQVQLSTSPIRSHTDKTTPHLGTLPLFTLPQTRLQFGIKKAFHNIIAQLYFEEDPFTYEGVDILISLRLTQYF